MKAFLATYLDLDDRSLQMDTVSYILRQRALGNLQITNYKSHIYFFFSPSSSYSIPFHHLEPLIPLDATNHTSTSTASLQTHTMNADRRSFLQISLLPLHGLQCITTVTFVGCFGLFLSFSTNLTALLVLLYEYVLIVRICFVL